MNNFILPLIVCLILALTFGLSIRNYDGPKSKVLLALTVILALIVLHSIYNIYIRAQPYQLVVGVTKETTSLIKQGTYIKYSFTYEGNYFEDKESMPKNFNQIELKSHKYKVKVWKTPFGGIVSEMDFFQEVKE